MKRKKTLMWMVAGAVFVLAVTVFVVRAVRRDGMMHAALAELQAQNQAGAVFGSDSAAQVLVRYFDEPWHRRNDRVLAYYLLGRAHADMGEAPQAIEAYQTATEMADTTSADCDFRLLRSVYGQMANVFNAQNLPEDEKAAIHRFIHYSWMMGDTLWAVDGYRSLERPYYLLGEYDSILIVDDKARSQLLELGYKERAASALITPIYINIERQEYEKAKQGIDIVRSEANIFNEDGTLKPGREMFYYTLGFYFDGIHQLDSAEYYYRRVLNAGEQEAGYKGLLSVYSKRGIADSIAKFAPLYADANDAMHRKMNSNMVHQTNAQYQYARHQRLAHRYEQQASRRLRLILIILCLLFLSIVLYYRHHRHVQKVLQEKENHLLTLHLQLMTVTDSLRSLKEEHSEQESQLDELLLQKESLEKQLLDTDVKYRTFYEDERVQKFRMMADPSQKIHVSKYEWELLISFFQDCFPKFASAVQGLDLKEKEWQVIVLTELGFQTGDMCSAMHLSGNSITYIKRALSKKLFGQDGLITFQINLKTAIVTGRFYS